MSKKIFVEIEVGKTVKAEIRYKEGRTNPWDWYVDDDVESDRNFKTMGEAVEDAEEVLGS